MSMRDRIGHTLGVSNDTIYDFRSDTATYPDKDMLEALHKYRVGDDVRGEDPTVRLLEEKVAKMCNKEAALFVCTGTMSNQLAIRTHVTLLGAKKEVVAQQVYLHELGGIAFHSGASVKAITVPQGQWLTAEIIKENLQQWNDLHHTYTSIESLENTLNGWVYPIDEIRRIRQIAELYELVMHLDGARLWNACTATGLSLSDYAQYFDSISLCLSKGLGAPVGSVLVGSKAFIDRARQYRKLFGGGWRQAGLLAACGLYAIDNNWSKMKEVHANARVLYSGLMQLGFEGQPPETNMLWINAGKMQITFEEICNELQRYQEGMTELCLIEGELYGCRIVLHHQIPLRGVQLLLERLKIVLEQLKKKKGTAKL